MSVSLAAVAAAVIIGCPSARILGISCPCCGATRAWLALFRGDAVAAIGYNALFWGYPIAAVLYAYAETCATTGMQRKLQLVLLGYGAVVFLNWILP